LIAVLAARAVLSAVLAAETAIMKLIGAATTARPHTVTDDHPRSILDATGRHIA
jgi:hypothetical protein